jgi:hypothetical protein
VGIIQEEPRSCRSIYTAAALGWANHSQPLRPKLVRDSACMVVYGAKCSVLRGGKGQCEIKTGGGRSPFPQISSYSHNATPHSPGFLHPALTREFLKYVSRWCEMPTPKAASGPVPNRCCFQTRPLYPLVKCVRGKEDLMGYTFGITWNVVRRI